MSSHQPRHAKPQIKDGPCGRLPTQRSPYIHTFERGSTVGLEWDEYIAHPGYFRISFDADGDDDFPTSFDELAVDESVIEDDLFYHETAGPGGSYDYELTLPDQVCENCTLQLIQVMEDRMPPTLYFNCLDIRLVPETDAPIGAITGLAVVFGLRRRSGLRFAR